jgi:hypothetical protein
MVRSINVLPALGAACALVLLSVALPALAQEKGKLDAPPAGPEAAEGAPEGGKIQPEVKMRDILAEGFLIRTTVLVPADAVTRQLGKLSPDSIILTLQKETAIAVCYYTLKAYVKQSLTDIASCTVFR